MRSVLVDSSVWIHFLREGTSQAAQRLDQILSNDRAVMTNIIRVELLSGARSEIDYERLERFFSALPILSEPIDFWNQVARARFRLARQGIQASIMDLSIALLAQVHGCSLFTLDRQFQAIARVIPIRFFH